MSVYEKTTKLSLDKAMSKIERYLAEQGLTKDPAEADGGCTRFSGGDGFVEIHPCTDGKKTVIEFETREWNYQVKTLLKKL